MIPPSQYQKSLHEQDFGIYFADYSDVYFGKGDKVMHLSGVESPTCLIFFEKHLYAGTEDGKIIDVKKKKQINQRKGMIHRFLVKTERKGRRTVKTLYDVSKFGSYLVAESFLPLDKGQEAYIADTPKVFCTNDMFSQFINGKLVALTGEDHYAFSPSTLRLTEPLRTNNLWYRRRDTQIRDSGERLIATVPPEAKDITIDSGHLFYLQDNSLEQVIIPTQEIRTLFPDHLVRAYEPVRGRTRP